MQIHRAAQHSADSCIAQVCVLSALCHLLQDERCKGATAAQLAGNLDQRVWVGWPFLREAIIHAASDKSLKVGGCLQAAIPEPCW